MAPSVYRADWNLANVIDQEFTWGGDIAKDLDRGIHVEVSSEGCMYYLSASRIDQILIVNSFLREEGSVGSLSRGVRREWHAEDGSDNIASFYAGSANGEFALSGKWLLPYRSAVPLRVDVNGDGEPNLITTYCAQNLLVFLNASPQYDDTLLRITDVLR
jgi:hypothetical protein